MYNRLFLFVYYLILGCSFVEDFNCLIFVFRCWTPGTWRSFPYLTLTLVLVCIMRSAPPIPRAKCLDHLSLLRFLKSKGGGKRDRRGAMDSGLVIIQLFSLSMYF